MEVIFKPFWFEGNLFFQMVNGLEDLKHLTKNYHTTMSVSELFSTSKETIDGITHLPLKNEPHRTFGLRREHKGETTLYDYLKEEGVDVEALIAYLEAQGDTLRNAI